MSVNRALDRPQNTIPIFDITSTEEGVTPPVGWTMLKEGKLLAAAKSYGITGGVIVLVVAVLSLMAGFISGLKLERSRNDTFILNGTRYLMVGIAEIPGVPGNYMPIYKTEIQASKDYAEGRFK